MYEASAVINSTVSAGKDGTLYFGSDDDRLHAVTTNGTQKWRLPVGKAQNAPAVADDGTVYVGTASHTLTAVSPEGVVRWECRVGEGIRSSPAIGADGTIYVGADDRKLYAITPDGAKKWEYETGSYIFSAPAIASDGTIYFGSLDRFLYALNPDGTLKWRVTTGGEIWASPAIGSNGTVYIPSFDGKMYAFSPEGIKLWEVPNAGGRSSPVIGGDGTIYAGRGASLVAINPQGTERWRFQAGGPIYSTPAVGADGTIYFGADDSKIYAVNATGTKKWEYETGNVVQTCSPTIVQGRMYIGSADGFLYAFNIGTGAASSSWPMFHREPQHQGRMPASGPPVVNSQPEDQILAVGSNLVFRAAATGQETLAYQWRFNGNPLQDNARISGSRTGALLITVAQITDSGSYSVVITNLLGTATSRAAQVSVRPNYIVPGTKLWEYALSNVVNSSPAQAPDGTYYVGSDGGFLHAVNPDGSGKWDFSIGSQIWGSPTVGPDGTVFFGAMFPSNAFYAVNPNGTLRWKHRIEGNVQTTPAIGQSNEVYFTSTDGKLVAFNPAGEKLWDFDLGQPYQSGAVVDRNGTIYVSGTRPNTVPPEADSTLYVLRPDGTLLWSFSERGPFLANPVLTDDGRIYLCSFFNEGKLFCLDLNGNLQWEHATGAALGNAPVIGPDGTIYLAHNDQVFFAINPDGTRKWRFNAPGSTRASAAVSDDGNIYFGAMDGNLYSLNSAGGTNWLFPTVYGINGSTAPLITDSGAVVFGAAGKLYAVQGSETLAQSSWPMFNRDRQHTGRQPATERPEVQISKPSHFTALPAGQPVVIEALASGGVGGVRDVQFFNGTNRLATDERIPFSLIVTNLAPGFYDLSAIASDHAGKTATSVVSTLIVNSKPQVTITSPTNGAVFAEGNSVSLRAATVDPVGLVIRVEFTTTNEYLGFDSFSPFEVEWTPPKPGTYQIVARATDQFAERVDSQPVTITVNSRPSISFASPADNTRFFLNEPILLRASVPNPENDIASVRFTANGQVIGTDTTAPYELTWTNATVGAHHLDAIVTDTLGLTNSAPSITLRVDTRLSVALNSPLTDSVFFSPTNVMLAATVNAQEAPIQRVEFGNRNLLLGIRTNAPFSLIWTNPPVGRHSLSATARDALGTVVMSATVSITVHSETAILATDDFYEIEEDLVLQVEAAGVLTNDVNLNPEPLRALLVTQTTRGSIILSTNGSFIYRPGTNFHGTDSFSYRALAGARSSETTAVVTIVVKSVNDLPLAESKTVIATEDQELAFSLRGTDADTNLFRYEIVTPALHGGAYPLSQSTDPQGFIYRPDPHFSGADRFSYRVFDGFDYSTPATVIINVQPVEDAPVGNAENYFARYNQILHIGRNEGVLANDFDPENAGVTALLETNAASGQLTLQSNGAFSYMPNPGFIGTDQFTYRPSDGTNSGSTVTVSLSVGDERWTRFPYSAFRTTIHDMVTAADGRLYAAGAFSSTVSNDGARARGVAIWDGERWEKVGNGPSNGIFGQAHALATLGTNLVAGGEFYFAGGRLARNVALWNGHEWRSLGEGVNGPVYALAARGIDLFAAGRFNGAGANLSSNVARWNGVEWSPLEQGLNGRVNALAVLADGSLIAGGTFTNGTIRNIARWNGSNWQPVDQGIDGPVLALASQGNQFYAAGDFSKAGNLGATNIAFWNGSAWQPRGAGIPTDALTAIKWDGTNVFAGERIVRDAPTSIFVYRWDGTSWNPLPEVLWNDRSAAVEALHVHDGQLHVGGYFISAGSATVDHTARWDGQHWQALHHALVGGFVSAVTGDGTNIFLGGSFTSVGGISANRVVRWDGTDWGALGTGINGPVKTLARGANGTLYAAGEFSQASGNAARNIAQWTGRQWLPLAAGLNSKVHTLKIGPDGHLYAGGDFTASGATPARRLARWNGSAWSEVGGGVGGSVLALEFNGPELHVGGGFYDAGGVTLNNIGVWTGSNWRPLGTGFPQETSRVVYSLAVRGEEVFAGGNAAGSKAFLSRWDGSQWQPIADEVFRPGHISWIEDLQVVGDRLFAGGIFWNIDNIATRGIAEWDGSQWIPLGSGMEGDSDNVSSIFHRGTSLFLGGPFQQAGRLSSRGFAEWRLTNSPPSVRLVLPAGPDYVVDSNIQLVANVSDSDNSITKVEFFESSNLIGSDTEAPFSITWPNVFTGEYRLYAKVTDSSGSWTISDLTKISVTPPTNNLPPTVRFIAPLSGAVYMRGESVFLEATASDPDGSIRQVTFLDGMNVIGVVRSAPFELSWANENVGEHHISAVAMDNLGATSTAKIILRRQLPPEVYMAGPRHGDDFEGPRNILLDADARDDKEVTNVEFYVNGSLLGRYHYNSTPNYYYSWTNVALGTYSISAKAFDNEGGFTFSSNIVITVDTVNRFPEIRILSPSSQASFSAPTNVNITVQASDPDGTIAAVEYFASGSLLGRVSSPPYNFDWRNLTEGNYCLSAVAIDNRGGQKRSSDVCITITNNPAAVPKYRFVDIGLANLRRENFVYGINSHGVAAGSARDSAANTFPYRFTNGTIAFLSRNVSEMGLAVAINTDGDLAGGMNNQGFVTRSNAIILLGTLGGPSGTSFARGLNDFGWVVGQTSMPDGGPFARNTHAFLHNGTAMIDLGTLGGRDSSARAINKNGVVVGDSHTSSNSVGFIYDSTNGMRALPTLGGHAAANAINDLEQIAGTSANAYGYYRPVVMTRELIVDLGTFYGETSGTALDINNRGQVVGTVGDGADGRAFLWQNCVMYDLNRFLPEGSDWVLTEATAINDKGWIVGHGRKGFTIQEHQSFLLIPEDSRPTSPFSPNGQFQLCLPVPLLRTYVLQVSTDLRNWTPLSTNHTQTGIFQYSDAPAPELNRRFYRLLQR